MLQEYLSFETFLQVNFVSIFEGLQECIVYLFKKEIIFQFSTKNYMTHDVLI